MGSMADELYSRIPDTPISDDTARLERIRGALERLNYSYDGVRELLGERAFEAMARDQVVPGTWRVQNILDDAHTTDPDRRLARIIGFFLFARTLTRAELADALGGEPALNDFIAANLVELAESENTRTPENSGEEPHYRAVFDLRPHSADDGTELWVASDLGAHQRPGVLRKDHVLGIGQASLTLAQITERTPVARALDVGTGCGIQTFHLLAHADHVTATDISPRALAFARFNLLLNAPALKLDPQNLEARVSLRQGSLLEPVAGEQFDLVVSNPPFVITPRRANESSDDQFTYRDGGLPGDDIVSTLIRRIPEVLVPGGRAQMLGNWEIHRDNTGEAQPWDARLRTWFAESATGTPSEAWVIQREVLTPESYAETWLKDASENRDRDHYENTYRAYLDDFKNRNVHSIGFGMLWLRRPAHTTETAPLNRFEDITYPIAQPIAQSITEAVARFDRLTALTDQALAETHLVLAEDVTEERHGRPGAEHPNVILLRAGSGLCRTILLSTETAGFVSACDGELSIGQILGALAVLLGWEDYTPDAHAAFGTENEHPRDTLLVAIRELVEKSFLHFADENS